MTPTISCDVDPGEDGWSQVSAPELQRCFYLSSQHRALWRAFMELLKEDRECSQHGRPGDVPHGAHGLALRGLEKGGALGLLPAHIAQESHIKQWALSIALLPLRRCHANHQDT